MVTLWHQAALLTLQPSSGLLMLGALALKFSTSSLLNFMSGHTGVAGNWIGTLEQGGWMQRGRKAEECPGQALSEPLQEQGVFAMM